MGVNIMIAGLACQVASLLLFVVLCVEYGLRVRSSPERLNMQFASVYNSKMWKLFIAGKSQTRTPACRCAKIYSEKFR